MHLGLIGGIGPAATVVYYTRLADRCRDAGVPLDLTIVNADIQTLADNARADRRIEQAAVYVGLIDRLAAAGARVAAITSIGGSFCEEETRSIASLPLVSAFAPLDAHFAALGVGCVGILGTETVMRTQLYGKLKSTRAVVSQHDLGDLGQAYVDMALSGICTDAQRAAFFAAGHDMVANQGADAVVLAGTDLGLAFDGQDPGFRVIDAIDAHVNELFQLATGTKTVEDLAR